MNSTRCPSDDLLQSLLRGTLDADAEQCAQDHLEQCEACRCRLDQLAGSGDAIFRRLRQYRRDAPATDVQLRTVVEQIKGAGQPAGGEQDRGEQPFPFLEPADHPDLLGRLGRHEVKEVLGRGGMGIVFLARDRDLQRLEAIKVVVPELAAVPTVRRRFLREARSAASIRHENVVTIYAVDTIGDIPYLVMEYVPGKTVEETIQRGGPLPLPRVIALAAQAAAGLSAAHREGVIHRDVKPGNILLDERSGSAKISDFGLARAADDAQLTQDGMMVGTPSYMSPEQAQGLDLDARSDLFSFGCVLYAMCTGVSPFFARTTVEAIRRVCEDRPAPAINVNPEVPQWLSDLIDSLLAKDRQQRPQSADAVLAILRHATPGSSPSLSTGASVAQDTIEAQPGQPPQSSRGVAGASPVGTPNHTTPSIAVLPLVNMSADAQNEYFGDGLAEELINALNKVPGLKVAARSSSFQFKNQTLDVREIGRRLGVASVVEGSVRQAGSRVRITVELVDVASGFHRWSERYDRELGDIFAVQDDLAHRIVETLKLEMGGDSAVEKRRPTGSPEAYTAYLRGRYYWNQRTPDGIQRAIQFYREALNHDADYALAHAGLADGYLLLGVYRLGKSAKTIPVAKQEAELALTLNEQLAEAHTSLGVIRAVTEYDWSGAETHLRRAIELDPHYATARLWYVLSVLLPHHRWEEALEQASLAETMDPMTAMNTAGRGIVLTYQRRYAEAVDTFDRALDAEQKSPVVRLWAAIAHASLGNFDRALELTASSRAFESLALEFEGWILALAGRRAAAEIVREQLVDRFGQGDHVAALSLAKIACAWGDPEDGLHWLQQAIHHHVIGLELLAVDPCYDILRDNPEFSKLLDRLHLPQV